MPRDNRIEIRYCAKCRWLLRAAWMAQELLSTFENEINSLTLVPVTGGQFEIIANDDRVWSRHDTGRFPEITELKQLIRDVVAPDRDLGHVDKRKHEKT
ncbi:MAG: SelT/SelW/SelH family protein [Pseudomonadota bacterium]